MSRPTILFVDAYDSFSASIVALLRQLSEADVVTIRIDTNIESRFLLDIDSFLQSFDAIVLGPGPGNPLNEVDIGLFKPIWKISERHNIPILGICLGFQNLCSRYGFSVERLPVPCHGHARNIFHANIDIFENVGSVIATQYNSLGVRSLQKEIICKVRPDHHLESDPWFDGLTLIHDDISVEVLEHGRNSIMRGHLQILAWSEDGYVMAAKHRLFPFWGLQFHPESCKSTESCHILVKRWWDIANRSNQLLRKNRTYHEITSSIIPAALSLSLPLENLLTRLRALTSITTSSVHHRSAPSRCSGEQVADLCYSMSTSADVVMLESTKKGRFCIYGVPDETTWHLEVTQSKCTIRKGQSIERFEGINVDSVLPLIERLMGSKKVVGGPPHVPFWGGMIGFMTYEFGLNLLGVDDALQSGSKSTIPQISLLWIDRSVVIDLEKGCTTVQSLRENDSWINDIALRLEVFKTENISGQCELANMLTAVKIKRPDHDRYIAQIRSCRSELLAGNSYELCLTTEATITTPTGAHHPYMLYKNLQRHNPVPYAAYMRLGSTTLISSSPEKFLGWSRDGIIDMVPMKGTVKKTPDMTLKKATKILSTPKETAENLMIADLIRHDLFSATNYGDARVEVVKLCEVIEHETVYQLVSHIQAFTPYDLCMTENERRGETMKVGCRALQSSLPPGSMTGAPKKRSCEILKRLERRPRGLYSGVVGYMDVGGAGFWSVCIRSAFASDAEIRDGRQIWHVGAGGAITVLSDEEEEWQEMVAKLESVLNAFQSI